MGPKTKGRAPKGAEGSRSIHGRTQYCRTLLSPWSRCLSLIIRAMIRFFLRCPSATKCNRSNPSRRGYLDVNWCVFTVFSKVEDKFFRYTGDLLAIYSGQGGDVRACDAREWCLQSTGVVPRRYKHAHRPTDTWPVARGTHVEGTAKARRQYVERAFAVGFSACDSVRRRHGGRKRHALPVRWLQNHFQTPINRRRRRIWDVTPPQHQTRKSPSTYGGLWPRH